MSFEPAMLGNTVGPHWQVEACIIVFEIVTARSGECYGFCMHQTACHWLCRWKGIRRLPAPSGMPRNACSLTRRLLTRDIRASSFFSSSCLLIRRRVAPSAAVDSPSRSCICQLPYFSTFLVHASGPATITAEQKMQFVRWQQSAMWQLEELSNMCQNSVQVNLASSQTEADARTSPASR